MSQQSGFTTMARLRAGLALSSIVLLVACGGGSGSGSGSTSSDGSLGGAAQKGPFQPGGEATAQQLADDGSATDPEATGVIGDSGGYSFDADAIGWTGPSLLRLSGHYFDETKGTFSGEARELHAVLDGVGAANVNLYTHFAAARTRQLMSEGDAFGDALQQAHGELQTLTGIASDPRELDLLEANAALERDSANLLLVSAALLEANLGQSGIDAIAADFADDGQVNGSVDGSGESAFADVQAAADANPNLLEQARSALQSQYGSEPPQGSSDGMAWILDPCTSARLSEPRVVCEGEPFYGNHRDDSGEFVTFIPEVSGHYTIELFGDPNVSDDNTRNCSWVIHSDADRASTELGDSYETDGRCGVEDVTTFRLTGGREYYIRPVVSQYDDTGPDARFRLSVTRVSEGKELASGAVAIPVGRTYEAVVGKLIGTSTDSYYRFEASQGRYTITASGYPCGSGGEMRLNLYEDAFNTKIDDAWEEGCLQSLEVDLAGGTYYLEVQNWLGGYNRDTFRPAPGRVRFDLTVTP